MGSPSFHKYGQHIAGISWFNRIILFFCQEYCFIDDGLVYFYKTAFERVYLLRIEKLPSRRASRLTWKN